MTIVVLHTQRKMGVLQDNINTVCEARMQNIKVEPPKIRTQSESIPPDKAVDKPVNWHVVSHTNHRGITRGQLAVSHTGHRGFTHRCIVVSHTAFRGITH
jgi:hypothetical protein